MEVEVGRAWYEVAFGLAWEFRGCGEGTGAIGMVLINFSNPGMVLICEMAHPMCAFFGSPILILMLQKSMMWP